MIKDKVAIITGVAVELDMQQLKLLPKQVLKLLLVQEEQTALEGAAKITDNGGQVFYQKLDVSKKEDVIILQRQF